MAVRKLDVMPVIESALEHDLTEQVLVYFALFMPRSPPSLCYVEGCGRRESQRRGPKTIARLLLSMLEGQGKHQKLNVEISD